MTAKLLNNPDITLPRPAEPINDSSLNWKDNPAIQKLLDVVAQILAEEYIETAKNNPEFFTKNGEI